jgi:excinuclease UvrABC helicase subunit UvrB
MIHAYRDKKVVGVFVRFRASRDVIARLIRMQYSHSNSPTFARGTFRVRGDVLMYSQPSIPELYASNC